MKKTAKDILIRTIKTMCQAAVGYIGSATAMGQVDWMMCASTIVLAGIVCVLMNIANWEG